MSYLDNLENNLKALESREEKDPEQIKRERQAREDQKAAALQIAPIAEALKTGPFCEHLLTACRVIGHGLRTMVRITWVGPILRLEAKEKKLELRPTAQGVDAVYFVDGVEHRTERIDLAGDADAFARSWLNPAAEQTAQS